MKSLKSSKDSFIDDKRSIARKFPRNCRVFYFINFGEWMARLKARQGDDESVGTFSRKGCEIRWLTLL